MLLTTLLCLPPLWGASILFHGSPKPHKDSTFHERLVVCLATAQVFRSCDTQRQSASSHLRGCDAGGAAGCHPEVSRQCHQAARAVPREADWQLVRRELLDTLPWVL